MELINEQKPTKSSETAAAIKIAQTNIQLYNQLETFGYSSADIDKVARAYKLAKKMFSASFRGSGRPFLCHLVGSASVLANDKAPATEVAAALLHAAYASGQFPFDMHRTVTERKRTWIREAVGNEVEELIYAYHTFPWNRKTLKRLAAHIRSEEMPILHLRLANELDDLADNGLRFTGDAKRALIDESDNRRLLGLLANKAGLPCLERDLVTALKHYELKPGDRSPLGETAGQDFSYVLLPPSARERFAPQLMKLGKRILRRARLFISK